VVIIPALFIRWISKATLLILLVPWQLAIKSLGWSSRPGSRVHGAEGRLCQRSDEAQDIVRQPPPRPSLVRIGHPPKTPIFHPLGCRLAVRPGSIAGISKASPQRAFIKRASGTVACRPDVANPLSKRGPFQVTLCLQTG
jgi:hypothetical protein